MARTPAAGTPIVEATYTFRFSAAHRLHNPRFDPEENRRLYGRCNNPRGHGHTYRLEVTIRGPLVPGRESVAAELDVEGLVRAHVLDRFDQADLNQLIDPADGPTSTTEVLARLLWRILDGALPGSRLCRLRLEETPNNSFELDRHEAAGRRAPAA